MFFPCSPCPHDTSKTWLPPSRGCQGSLCSAVTLSSTRHPRILPPPPSIPGAPAILTGVLRRLRRFSISGRNGLRGHRTGRFSRGGLLRALGIGRDRGPKGQLTPYLLLPAKLRSRRRSCLSPHTVVLETSIDQSWEWLPAAAKRVTLACMPVY